MDTLSDLYSSGLFDVKYRAFLETISQLRPELHRYCSRMMGSVIDGEDVVQDALFVAYRSLDQYDETRALKPWLFQIAHNRCIDFLRKRGTREEVEAEETPPLSDSLRTEVPSHLDLGHAIEQLVTHLPPKERACVLLKDVFDYSILEIADLVGSTPGGVKAALNRGRTKLASLSAPEPTSKNDQHIADPELSELLRLYVEGFNQRDWKGLRELISADAQLLFADGYAGRLKDSTYFSKYESAPFKWKMVIGKVDGEPVVIILSHDTERGWTPKSLVRLKLEDHRIVRITDYLWCSWLLSAAKSVIISN
jgi:RNA polymerase sigma-70 factor (ECF subfamily)